MKNILHFFLSCLTLSAASQDADRSLSAACFQLNACSAELNDAFSFAANPAALAAIKKFSLGLFTERRFLLADLSVYTAGAAVPVAHGGFGWQGSYSGNYFYHQSVVGLGYARQMDRLDGGLLFRAGFSKAAGYALNSFVQLTAGVVLKVTQRFRIGVEAAGRTAVLHTQADRVAQVRCAMALGYEAAPGAFVGARLEKIQGEAVGLTAGLEYHFAARLFARVGMITATSSFYAGAGVWINNFRLDLSFVLHPQLGPTPAFLFLYRQNPQP